MISGAEAAGRRSRFRTAVHRYWSTVLAGGLATLVLVALVVAAMTSAVAFEPYNPDWDGTNDFRTDVADDPGVEAEIATGTEQYAATDPNGTVAIVLAPDEPYAGTDADRVRTFVEDGGTLVLLDSFRAYGNALLESTGAEARLNGRIVLDERENIRGPAMPVATETAAHSRTDDVDQLTLNHGTTVDPGNATVLVATSEFGYLGENATAVPEETDELTAYPVATTEPVGNGTVITIADPSIAINAMYDEPDNARFLANQYADADRVVFDRSHSPDPPPLTAAVLAIRTSPALQLLIGLMGVASALVVPRITTSRLGVRSPFHSAPDATSPADGDELGPSDEELIAAVCRHHPEWDPEHVRSIVKALNRDQDERRTEQ